MKKAASTQSHWHSRDSVRMRFVHVHHVSMRLLQLCQTIPLYLRPVMRRQLGCSDPWMTCLFLLLFFKPEVCLPENAFEKPFSWAGHLNLVDLLFFSFFFYLKFIVFSVDVKIQKSCLTAELGTLCLHVFRKNFILFKRDRKRRWTDRNIFPYLLLSPRG